MRLVLIIGLSVTLFAAGFYAATVMKDPGSAVAALVGIVSIFSSFLVALATVVLVVEAHRTREAQTAPDISVSFTQPNGVRAVYIVIKNDGAGVARNIKFSVLGDIKTHYGRTLRETGYMQGIGYLVPGQQLRNFFARVEEITQQPAEAQLLTISVSYKSENGKRYTKEFVNDFSELKHITGTDHPLGKIGRELEQLRKIAAELVE